MDKYIINEDPMANGAHELHNASTDCDALPDLNAQMLIGYFANHELAYKRARMNWPTAKIQACEKCCVTVKNE